jgi:hypothetical protein
MGNKIAYEKIYNEITKLNFVVTLSGDIKKSKIKFSSCYGSCYVCYKIKITIDQNYIVTGKDNNNLIYQVYFGKDISKLIEILNKSYIKVKNNSTVSSMSTKETTAQAQILPSITTPSYSISTIKKILSSPKKYYNNTYSYSDYIYYYSSSGCGSSGGGGGSSGGDGGGYCGGCGGDSGGGDSGGGSYSCD